MAIETAFGIEGESFDLGPPVDLKIQPVVAPELVGDQNPIPRVDEEFAGQGQAVGNCGGHDGQPEFFGREVGVLVHQLGAPMLAQIHTTRSGRIGVRVAGVDIQQVLLDRGQIHGAPSLGRDADGGVESVGLLLGFGGLGEDALGKVEPFPIRGEHGEHLGPSPVEVIVQLGGQGVQGCRGRSSHYFNPVSAGAAQC